MKDNEFNKMDLGVDFVNEHIELYPLMGGTHYGSGSTESFGGTVREAVTNGKYMLFAANGSFSPQDLPPKKNDGRMKVKRLISTEAIEEFFLHFNLIDHSAVGLEIKSPKTHLSVELSSDGYLNVIAEGRYFVFSTLFSQDESHRLENTALRITIEDSVVTVYTKKSNKEKNICSLRLDALTAAEELEVCFTATLECPSLCEITEVCWK